MPYDMKQILRDAKKRRKIALGWRNKGMKVKDIAEKLDCSRQRVWAILQQARRD